MAELFLWRPEKEGAGLKEVTRTMDFGFKRAGVETSLSFTLENLRHRHPAAGSPFFWLRGTLRVSRGISRGNCPRIVLKPLILEPFLQGSETLGIPRLRILLLSLV